MELTPFVLTLMAGLSTGLGGILAVWMRPTPRMLAVSMGFAGGIMLTVSRPTWRPRPSLTMRPTCRLFSAGRRWF